VKGIKNIKGPILFQIDHHREYIMPKSKLPIYSLAILGLIMHQSGFAIEKETKTVIQTKPKVTTLPCLIGNTSLAEKLIDFNHTKSSFVPYRFFGIPVIAGATFQINTKPKKATLKESTALSDDKGWVSQINHMHGIASDWITGNLLFDGAMLFHPWVVGYASFMGHQLSLHNYALIFGEKSFPLSLTVGHFHIPFGLGASEDLEGGLTGKLGSAENTNAMSLNGDFGMFNKHHLKLKGFVFSPKLLENKLQDVQRYGGNIQYEAEVADINMTAGVSYATKLVKSARNIEGFAGYANLAFGILKLKAEYVQGRNLFFTEQLSDEQLSNERSNKGKEKSSLLDSMPYAMTAEASVHTPLINRDAVIVIGYSQGENGKFLGASWRFYTAFKTTISKRVRMNIGYQYEDKINMPEEEKVKITSINSQSSPVQNLNVQFAFNAI
jgi:hypothetical protein